METGEIMFGFLLVFLPILLGVCLITLLEMRSRERRDAERDALKELLAGMVKESPPARTLPPLRPPTPSMGMSPKEEIDYLKEAIEQRQTPRPDPPKPGRLS